jgi:hypothetical protein
MNTNTTIAIQLHRPVGKTKDKNTIVLQDRLHRGRNTIQYSYRTDYIETGTQYSLRTG